MKLSKLNRVTHRDIGYLITGLTLIYAISGIALNHKHDWNPNYIFENSSFTVNTDISRDSFDDQAARDILKDIGHLSGYKTFYFPTGNRLTIFVDGGFVQIDARTGSGTVEMIKKRPLFYQFNFLHYNPGIWWKYFSDIYCIALITVTLTGLFIIKGKNGITRRGAILTIAGVILPLLFLFIY